MSYARDPVSVSFDSAARDLLDRAYARPGQWVGSRLPNPTQRQRAHWAAQGINVDEPDTAGVTRNARTRWGRGFVRALEYQHRWQSGGGAGVWRVKKRATPRQDLGLLWEVGRALPAARVGGRALGPARAVRIQVRRDAREWVAAHRSSGERWDMSEGARSDARDRDY